MLEYAMRGVQDEVIGGNEAFEVCLAGGSVRGCQREGRLAYADTAGVGSDAGAVTTHGSGTPRIVNAQS